MKKFRHKISDLQISSWLTIQSFILIGAAIFSLLVVNLGSIIFFDQHTEITFGYFIGLILPFSAILGALNNFLVKSTYRYFTILTDAIKKVADGHFDTKIDLEKAGPFTIVYENFNKMSSELEAIHILRNDFINNYSHEFKTPIVSIKGFADLLLDTEVTDEQKIQYLKIISDESARLAELTNSTILLSKLDSQQIIEDKSEYSLDEQLRKCIIMLSTNLNGKSIEINSNLDDCTYYGNEAIMQHLWLNLLSNAIKFTPKNGCIFVSLTTYKNEITVEIRDTGIGMNNETLEHIFDKYFQGTSSQAKKGLGLGLSIVQRIIKLIDGDISVKSSENNGTTFTVKFNN